MQYNTMEVYNRARFRRLLRGITVHVLWRYKAKELLEDKKAMHKDRTVTMLTIGLGHFLMQRIKKCDLSLNAIFNEYCSQTD